MKGPTSFRFLLVKLGLFAVLTFSGAATSVAYAGFVVNSELDTHDMNPGNGQCADANGKCSLRAAIEECNALPEFPLEVITLPSGFYQRDGNLDYLEILKHLYLEGAGSNSTFINGDVQSGVFVIRGKNTPIVHISGVTIQNGHQFASGGGIFVGSGAYLALSNSTVRNNKSELSGGGIANLGRVQIFSCTIQDNSTQFGGGLATQSGGGIINSSSTSLTIDDSTISGNQATRGGGINNSGHIEIRNSTISGNKAYFRGGGINNTPEGNIWIAFSTIAFNRAFVGRDLSEDSFGGGISNYGDVEMGNTILAMNSDDRDERFDKDYSPDGYSVSPAIFTSFRGNLVGIVPANFNLRDTIYGDALSDQVHIPPDPPLDPRFEVDNQGKGLLADNGGPTRTHALRSDSPAIDMGTGVTSATFFDCPQTDQRGGARPAGRACDIGAFELVPLDVTDQIRITRSGFRFNRATQRFVQQVTLQNIGDSSIHGFVALVLANLSSNAALENKTGVTANVKPYGSSFIMVNIGDTFLSPQETASVNLEFSNPTNAGITYAARVFAISGVP